MSELCHEQWRPVTGYEGRYEVSSNGRVRALARWIIRRTKGGTYHPWKVRECVLKPQKHGNYLGVMLTHEGNVSKPFYIHTLVTVAFRGPRPSAEHEVNHLDEDRHNNQAVNLEWVTHSENMRHSKEKITAAVRKAVCRKLP